MLNVSRNGSEKDRLFSRAKLAKRAKRKRQHALESLESRTLLAFNFTYGGLTGPQIVNETGGNDSFTVVNNGFGFLEWSQDGVNFSPQWGANPADLLLATPGTMLTINQAGDSADVNIGVPDMGTSASASAVQAQILLNPNPGLNNSKLTIDDSQSNLGNTTYSVSAVGINTTITGSINAINVVSHLGFTGGATLLGSASDNVFNVTSTYAFQGTRIIPGAGDNVVNVGSGGTLTGINGKVAVNDPAVLNIDDSSDNSHATATIDNNSGDAFAPSQLTGLGNNAIEWGPGVTDVNILGGTSAFGLAGVTFNINGTQDGTTTSITGGPEQNSFHLSNAFLAGGLENLPGPVSIFGGSSFLSGTGDIVTLDDSSADFNDDYDITSTTVTRPGFGGLTYDDNIGTLTLLAENRLGTNGNNTINIDSTANFVITNVSGQGGTDTINVNDTGILGVLNVFTGFAGSTVNVVANNQLVNLILLDGDTVNIGSTGGFGTMEGILGPINILNVPSFYSLTFHDENDMDAHTWTLDNDDTAAAFGTAMVSLDGGIGTTTYRPGDLTSPLTINGGTGGNTYIVNNTTSFVETDLNTGFGGDTVEVFATGTNTLNINGQGGIDTVTLGALAGIGMQNLGGTINVTNTVFFSALTLDDSEDTVGQDALMTDNGTTGTITGLSPATITYQDGDISSLTVLGGSGGNSFTVDGTLSNGTVPVTTIDKGAGAFNFVTVNATSADSELDLVGSGGPDFVTINGGGMILGTIDIDEVPGPTNLIIDLSTDGLSHVLNLSSDGTTGTLSDALGNMQSITYTVDSISSLEIDTDPTQLQTLNVDFGEGGNPIPTGSPVGLIYNADGLSGASGSASHTLNLFGELPSGPFDSETHNANDPAVFPDVDQYGSIFFTDAGGVNTGINYTGLLPIVDVAPVTTYTFNDFADDQSFTADDSSFLGFDTVRFANTPISGPATFETTNVANKTDIVFNTPYVGTNVGIIGVVDITTPSTGLATLTFNTPTNGDNTVSFVNTPPGVVTSLVGGQDEDVTNVTGLGVPAGTVLFLNGGGSTNTLNYDAGLAIPSITPGLLPGEVLITIPGAGVVDASNYQTINIINAVVTPPVITPGTPFTINSIEDFQLVNSLVGTFTFPLSDLIPGVFPIGTTLPAGLPASDFTATIDWGDGTSTTAGVVVQDANNPSVYDIFGTHTYTDPNDPTQYAIGLSINFAGGSVTVPISGIPITITLPAAGPVVSTATANVSNAAIAVSAYPIVGVEGGIVPSAPIGSFIDAGGASGSADPAGDYTATITVLDGTGATVITVPGTITQESTSNSYLVTAPDLDLSALDEGTYSVLLTVTKTVNTTTVSASGGASLVVADAPLTAGTVTFTPPSPTTGLPVTIAGTFTDGDTSPTSSFATDFSAVIDWGDGSPTSLGTITGTAPDYSVAGTHVYGRPGAYTVTINVVDDGGETTTITGSTTVADAMVTGSTKSFTAIEGINTGMFVLATFDDPNTLATLSQVNAQLAIGGWGDTSPGVAGINLTVQQIGFDPLNGQPMFAVLGSHTYMEETAAGLPNTLSVIITTLGGATTTLTSPPGGGVTVIDAALSSSNGTSITGVEGISTGTVVLGTFHDANPFATAADFTATLPIGGWGDGKPTAPVTLTVTQISPVAGPGSTQDSVFEITGAHTYAEEGVFAITINVTDDGGSATVVSGTAVIADAALVAGANPTVNTTEAAIFPVPVFSPPLFTGAVATFTDLNPAAPASDFTATIDWGDGTSPTAGLVTESGPAGSEVFTVSGSHTYAASGVNGGIGHYTISVFVVDDGGSRLTITNPNVNVADIPIVLTGILNPASDSGLSTGTTNVTNVNQPDFFGSSQPFSDITLSATPVGGGATVPIGTVEAGSDGTWNIVSTLALADGHYTITASAIDQFHQTTATTVITSNLQIDTVGPQITGMFFNRLNGEVDFTIKDLGAAPSGAWLASLLDSSNYKLTKVHGNKAFPGKWIVTDVSTSAGPVAGSYDVAVVFNSGKQIKGGFYLFTIRDSSNGASSVQDLAENHLDGNFYGSFPSGNGIPGSDFVAELSGYHNKIFAPQTIIGTANPKNGGAGGAPVGAVHSGIHTPAVPVGGGSVFGTDPKHLKGTNVKAHKKEVKVKQVVKVKAAPVGHANAKAKAHHHHDMALMALIESTKPGHKS